MSPEEIEAAKRICDAAWPSPWFADENLDNNGSIVATQDGKRVCDCYEFIDVYGINWGHDRRHASFIAFARTGWPKALAALQAAQEKIKDYEILSKNRWEIIGELQTALAAAEAEIERLKKELDAYKK